MSIKRLWVLISNCSRESLYLWTALRIVYTSFSVGNGTGPTTWAPDFFAEEIIFSADASRILWSNDFNLILILFICHDILSFQILIGFDSLVTNYLKHAVSWQRFSVFQQPRTSTWHQHGYYMIIMSIMQYFFLFFYKKIYKEIILDK